MHWNIFLFAFTDAEAHLMTCTCSSVAVGVWTGWMLRNWRCKWVDVRGWDHYNGPVISNSTIILGHLFIERKLWWVSKMNLWGLQLILRWNSIFFLWEIGWHSGVSGHPFFVQKHISGKFWKILDIYIWNKSCSSDSKLCSSSLKNLSNLSNPPIHSRPL